MVFVFLCQTACRQRRFVVDESGSLVQRSAVARRRLLDESFGPSPASHAPADSDDDDVVVVVVLSMLVFLAICYFFCLVGGPAEDFSQCGGIVPLSRSSKAPLDDYDYEQFNPSQVSGCWP